MKLFSWFTFFILLPALLYGQTVSTSEAWYQGECYEPAVAVSRRNAETLMLSASPGVVLLSTDKGATWKVVQQPTSQSKRTLALLPGRKGEYNAFFMLRLSEKDEVICQASDNGGTTWSDVGSFTTGPKQMAGVRIDEDSKAGEFVMTWTSIAEYGSKDPDKTSDVYRATSKDGKKWSSEKKISTNPGNCEDGKDTPRSGSSVASLDGRLYVTWSRGDNIYLDRSFDKGGMWLSSDITVAEQPGGWPVKVRGMDQVSGRPSMIIDNSSTQYNGSLGLIWTSQTNDQSSTVYFSRSHTFGDNWSPALGISDGVEGKFKFMPCITSDVTSGMIYAAYYVKGDDDQADVYLAYSSDNGASFKNRKLNEEPFSLTGTIGDFISIDAYQQTILVGWTYTKQNNRFVSTAVLNQEDLVKLPQKKGKKR